MNTHTTDEDRDIYILFNISDKCLDIIVSMAELLTEEEKKEVGLYEFMAVVEFLSKGLSKQKDTIN